MMNQYQNQQPFNTETPTEEINVTPSEEAQLPINQPKTTEVTPTESTQSTQPTQPTQSTQTTQSTPAKTQVTSSEAQPSPQIIDLKPTIQPDPSFQTSYILYAILAGIFVSFFWFEWHKWFKRKKKTELPAEAEKIVCETCGGSGKITKKRKVSVPCGHCKKTGNDICHYCSGTGRDVRGIGVPLEDIENYPKCLYCGGNGFPEVRARCCMCRGKGKEEYEESYEETCPTCKGSGWIKNW